MSGDRRDTVPQPERRREGWLRDWPMLIGLIASAALVFASTVVGAPARDAADRPQAVAAAASSELSPDEAPAAEEPAGEDAVGGDPAGKSATAKGAPSLAKKKPKASRTGAGALTPGTSAEAPSTAAPRKAPAKKPRAGNGGGGKGTSGGGTGSSVPLVVNVRGTSGIARPKGYDIAFSATTHKPRMGEMWKVAVAATKNGRPVAGVVRVDVVHQGKVVGHIHTGKLSRGKYLHSVRWPKDSVGHPLVVKTTVEVGNATQTFLFAVRVSAPRA